MEIAARDTSRSTSLTKEQAERELSGRVYEHGFYTDIEADQAPKGLNEDIIRFISRKKDEPPFMLDFRLKALRRWREMEDPWWRPVEHPPIDYQAIRYYSAPKTAGDKEGPASLDEVDPEILRTFERLGVPLSEQKRVMGVAVDAVFDSVSVGTTNQEQLTELGIVFCSISEALREHSELVRRYLGSVVPAADNFYSALNSAVFTDGSFCYIPPGVKCPLDLSTYFRINAAETGQFERTLIVADRGSSVNYVEGCTAPMRDENQLHAAVVEIVALDDAVVNYSTVQNWYGGDADGNGGIYNFVTKRGKAIGRNSKISWTQVEAGAAITWKYPSVILLGDGSVGEFYSVALTNNRMQADTGTKMIHIGKNTTSTIVSKGISADRSRNAYRGQVRIQPGAAGARNFTQCDSMLVGNECQANTFPSIEVHNDTATVEHEASTSRIGAEQLFYLATRGLDMEASISLLINGFCKEVFKKLPLEFSVEAVKLLEMKLEGSVG